MVREANAEELDKVIKLCNDYTAIDADWVSDSFTFTKENTFKQSIQTLIDVDNDVVNGAIVFYIFSTRCNIDVVISNPALTSRQQVTTLFTLLYHAGQEAKKAGCTHMQGSVLAKHTSGRNLFELWGGKNEDVTNTGVIFIEPDIDTYLADCEARM